MIAPRARAEQHDALDAVAVGGVESGAEADDDGVEGRGHDPEIACPPATLQGDSIPDRTSALRRHPDR